MSEGRVDRKINKHAAREPLPWRLKGCLIMIRMNNTCSVCHTRSWYASSTLWTSAKRVQPPKHCTHNFHWNYPSDFSNFRLQKVTVGTRADYGLTSTEPSCAGIFVSHCHRLRSRNPIAAASEANRSVPRVLSAQHNTTNTPLDLQEVKSGSQNLFCCK